ncbi:hypothetical protein B0H13DRAFT_1879872 [Mycena leptocephala]|nr:hypothetical protein B0H13DRAFT_1879872 [Mycena leptocephala]
MMRIVVRCFPQPLHFLAFVVHPRLAGVCLRMERLRYYTIRWLFPVHNPAVACITCTQASSTLSSVLVQSSAAHHGTTSLLPAPIRCGVPILTLAGFKVACESSAGFAVTQYCGVPKLSCKSHPTMFVHGRRRLKYTFCEVTAGSNKVHRNNQKRAHNLSGTPRRSGLTETPSRGGLQLAVHPQRHAAKVDIVMFPPAARRELKLKARRAQSTELNKYAGIRIYHLALTIQSGDQHLPPPNLMASLCGVLNSNGALDRELHEKTVK